MDEPVGSHTSLRQFLNDGRTDGIIILHKGVVVYEQYPRMTAGDRHMIFSITKVFVGTLIGMLEEEKRLDLDLPVETYLPELNGTSWAGTSVRDIADMSSGMESSEAKGEPYSDPSHKFYQLEASLGWRIRSPAVSPEARAGDVDGVLDALKLEQPAGRKQAYTSADTLILARIVERITGKRLPQAISEGLWSRIGAEGDGLMMVNEHGDSVAHAGMAVSLRDLARFGLLFTASTPTSVDPPVTASMIKRMVDGCRSNLDMGPQPPWADHACYQWDQMNRQGFIAKGGFGGQILVVDTVKDVVIAIFGANRTLDSAPPRLPLNALVKTFF